MQTAAGHVQTAIEAAAAAGIIDPATDAAVIAAEAALGYAEAALFAAEVICNGVQISTSYRESAEYISLYEDYSPTPPPPNEVGYASGYDPSSNLKDIYISQTFTNLFKIYKNNDILNASQTKITISGTDKACTLYLVGGGGGGSSDHGGGGGAGNLAVWSGTLPVGTYTVDIGLGGSGGVYDPANRDNDAATSGWSTIITNDITGDFLEAKGGQAWRTSGHNYGSGCGIDVFPDDYDQNTAQITGTKVLGDNSVFGTGIFSTGHTGYANDGGAADSASGSGGGGAGSDAPAVSTAAGGSSNGGGSRSYGFVNPDDATDIYTHYFAGGGGGGGYSTTYSRIGGYSSGGSGGDHSTPAGAGVDGTGGGGGGGGASATVANCHGGDGGHGIVFIEFE